MAVARSAWSLSASSAATVIVGELRLDNAADFPFAEMSSPAASILAAFEQEGIAVFDRIEGEFALCIWDETRRQLTLVRDALGRRPMFFAQSGTRVTFGSDAAQVARKSGKTALDLEEAASFLMQRGQTGARSFFAGVSRLPAGSLARFEGNGRTTTIEWWKPDTSPIALDDDALLAALDERFQASVAALRRRHPNVAAHLSAGLDSSLTAATISRQLAPGERLRTYCISPANPVESTNAAIGDEFPLAQSTAAMLGNVDVEKVQATDDNWLADGARYMRAAGMPYRNQPSLGWFSASYAAVAASGATGLIESTDGNATLSWVGNGAVPTMLRQGRWNELYRHIRAIRRTGAGSGLLTIPWGLWGSFPPFLADWVGAVRGIPRAATAGFLRARHPAVRTVEREIRAAGHWNRTMRPIRDSADRFTFLRWSDRASHFAAVERLYGIILCDPYSSKSLVELTSRIEEHRFLENGFGRRFARALLRHRVPDVVAAGKIDWLQSTDWRTGAIAQRPQMLDELDYADSDPGLRAFFDVPRLRREIMSWTRGPESPEAMTLGFAAVRAIGAIRFARWAADGAPDSP